MWVNFHDKGGDTWAWSHLLMPAPALMFHDLDATYCLFITCTQQVSDSWTWMYEHNGKAQELTLSFPIQEPHRGRLCSVVHVTCWHPQESKSHTPSGSWCVCVCVSRSWKAAGDEGRERATPHRDNRQVNKCSTAPLAPSHRQHPR